MGKINYGRVVLGGLVAGLIINAGEILLNTFILDNGWSDALKSLNRPPLSGIATGISIVLCFVLGILMTWVYAAIRPRLGAGPGTAICAGLIVWALAYAWSSVSGMAIGVFPSRLLLIGMTWGFFEVPIAAIAGAWFYREA